MPSSNEKQLIGGFLGAFAGGYFGATGAQLGWLAGSYLARPRGFPQSNADQLRTQTSGYGLAIPNIVGTQRLAGNIIWAQPRKSYKFDDGIEGFKLTCAIALCQGPVVGWNRIWIDDELKVDCTDGTPRRGIGKFYTGTQTQTVNDTMEDIEGLNNVPAYRGICYVVLKDFDLGPSKRIPKFEWQVIKDEF